MNTPIQEPAMTLNVSRRQTLTAVAVGAAAFLAPQLGRAAVPAKMNPSAGTDDESVPKDVKYKTLKVGNVEVFYREAGPVNAPVVLLLHGFPTSSHMFRNLIPLLADHYRLIAPDLPGFGNTQAPDRTVFAYTFDNLAKIIGGFTEALGLKHYAIYAFDYGAPTGYRLAMAHPERVTAIVSQNGNAYVEGLSDQWGAWQDYWRNPSAQTREACRASLSADTIINFQYLHGADPTLVAPDGYTLDIAYMARPDAQEKQLDLILDYRTNVALYPEFQKYFRTYQPPLLAVWGKNDPAFIPPGAVAYSRDIPNAEVHFLNTGHFALETHSLEVANLMREFLGRKLTRG